MSCFTALEEFINKYHQQHQQLLNELPRYYPVGEFSPCIEGDYDGDKESYVHWNPVKKDDSSNFNNVESALEMKLHQDIHDFYGKLYAAPIHFDSEFGEGELIQAWSQDNFELLQQNIIGHLMMKKKLKQSPTWFIGTIDHSDKMITVNNEDGSVWAEIPGEVQSEKMANSIEEFIRKLEVKPSIPDAPQHYVETIPEHPGILNSLKRMWRNLTSK
ncbi:SecY-interacting protein [Shewanella sp. OPT22]|nr:SecY-interacting protein [Shewanella sp. OPT22]